jgi:hypothetical protein
MNKPEIIWGVNLPEGEVRIVKSTGTTFTEVVDDALRLKKLMVEEIKFIRNIDVWHAPEEAVLPSKKLTSAENKTFSQTTIDNLMEFVGQKPVDVIVEADSARMIVLLNPQTALAKKWFAQHIRGVQYHGQSIVIPADKAQFIVDAMLKSGLVVQ